MATKKTIKRKVQEILSSHNRIYFDDYWVEVRDIFTQIANIGGFVSLDDVRYEHDENMVPVRKVWKFHVIIDGYSFHGILTAHGAGTVDEPLSRYDISAYLF